VALAVMAAGRQWWQCGNGNGCQFVGLVGAFNSITAIDSRERQLFIELLWRLVTSSIFVRC
jgi:hypothetical protein